MACLGHHGDQEGEYSDSLETVCCAKQSTCLWTGRRQLQRPRPRPLPQQAAAAAAAAESCIRRWCVPELVPRVNLVQGPASLVGSSSLYVRLHTHAHAHERHQYFWAAATSRRSLRIAAISHTNRVACFGPTRRCALRRWMEAMVIVITGVRTSARQSGGCRRRTCRLERLVDVLMRAGLASTNSALACCTAYAPPLYFAPGTLGPCSGECAWRCCDIPRR